MAFKVQLFWKGHKNLRDLPYGFDIYLVNVKTIRQIVQIFVAFSEKLNFKKYNATLQRRWPHCDQLRLHYTVYNNMFLTSFISNWPQKTHQ